MVRVRVRVRVRARVGVPVRGEGEGGRDEGEGEGEGGRDEGGVEVEDQGEGVSWGWLSVEPGVGLDVGTRIGLHRSRVWGSNLGSGLEFCGFEAHRPTRGRRGCGASHGTSDALARRGQSAR